MSQSAIWLSAALALLGALCVGYAQAQTPSAGMSFFVTSVGSGKGADFGGLDGADKHCQALATLAGAGHRTWRAYLSASTAAGAPAVNARDRIGTGPWQNVKGDVVAKGVDDLHGDNNLNKRTAVTEKGEAVPGRGDPVNKHDILTGSQADGRAYTDGQDHTCGNWTKSGEGVAQVGHHDRMGIGTDDAARSWNSSHPTNGCSDDALKSTGGAGLIYCFAVK